MTEIEKAKVLLKCQILKEAYCPGENLTGEVHLDVKEPVTFSALKLNVLGIEKISGSIMNSFSALSNTNSLTYLNHWIKFTSSARNNSFDESLTYAAGCYKFPFSVPLSPSLPPSFNSVNAQSYIRLTYTVAAIFEISKNRNVVSEAYFRIKSVVPFRQVAVHTNCQLRTDFEVPVYRHSFMGWVHGKQHDELIHLSARVDPFFICIAKRNGAGSRSKIPFTLRLSVRNNTLKAIKDVDAQIQQITNIRYAMLESSELTLIARSPLSKVSIQPGEVRDLAIEMKMDAIDFDTMVKCGSMPLPSFSTPFISSDYIVVVNFPKNKVQRDISFYGLINVVEEVSMARHSVIVPHVYTPANSVTEAQYLTYPENFSHLDNDMFMTEHQPYILRPAQEQCVTYEETIQETDWDNQNSEEVAEGDEAGEHEELPVHMMGTPLPGRIIRGQVYHSPIMRPCSVFEAFIKEVTPFQFHALFHRENFDHMINLCGLTTFSFQGKGFMFVTRALASGVFY